MQPNYYRWICLFVFGGVCCGCSEKVETEDKQKMIEEEAVEAKAVDSVDEIVSEKLHHILIPRLDFEDVSIEYAIDYLCLRSGELDVVEPDPSNKGLRFEFQGQNEKLDNKLIENEDKSINSLHVNSLTIPELRVRNVSHAAALKYICMMMDFRCDLDGGIVKISPKDKNAAWNDVGSVLNDKSDLSDLISVKLKNIRLADVSFEDVTIHELIDYLRLKSVEMDNVESNPVRKGINYVVYLPKGTEVPVVDEIRMRDASIDEILKEICNKTGMRYQLDSYSVILVPKDLQ